MSHHVHRRNDGQNNQSFNLLQRSLCSHLVEIFRISCHVSDVNETFRHISDVLQDIFVNEDSVHRVYKTAVGRSTMLVVFALKIVNVKLWPWIYR